MADFSGKTWFRNNISPYLVVIKGYINGQVTTLSTRLTTVENDVMSLKSITGNFRGGGYVTYASLPAAAEPGDWAILATDDVGTGTIDMPQYESGIYVKRIDGGWDFVSDLQTFQEIREELLSSDAEFAAGTSTSKVPTVKQVYDYIQTLYTTIGLNFAAKAGDQTVAFKVLPGAENSYEALNSYNFSGTISAAEAQADWSA